jgi:hypothetical protein
MAASIVLAALSPARAPVAAIPETTPHAKASPTATPSPPPNEFPIGSTIDLVLEGTISSGSSKANDVVQAHLKNAIVIMGTTVAAAGAPVRIRIVDAKPADNPDIYGYVDIYMFPLLLANGAEIPIRPPSTHLNVDISAGHESTVGIEDTVGDIFTPGLLFHVFRKGRNFVLEPGAVIHARTQATIALSRSGTVSVVTPAPMIIDAQTPHSSFNAMPLSTPAEIDKRKLQMPTENPYSPFPSPTPTF